MDPNIVARIKNNIAFIRDIHTLKKQKLRQRLRGATKEEIEFLCDCAFNILRKNIPLSSEQLVELRRPPVRKAVYLLASNNIPFSRRRQIVTSQTGGFLPILSIAAPILSGLLGSLASKITES